MWQAMQKWLASGFVALLLAGGAQAGPVSGQGTWETTLQARDLDGDGASDAFYDTVLNITWLRNANVNGPMDWDTANSWANSLTFGGFADWRLQTMIDVGEPGCLWSYSGGTDCGYNVLTAHGATTYSEIAHLYYVTLGNKAICNPATSTMTKCVLQAGYGLTNTGDFVNLQSNYYWSGLEYAPSLSTAWDFNADSGVQSASVKFNPWHAIAVREGDVRAVPEPRSLVLVLMALGSLVFLRRRRVVPPASSVIDVKQTTACS